MLAIQVIVNISMNLGLAPVVGVPLPLMSLRRFIDACNLSIAGILVNIDRKRAVF